MNEATRTLVEMSLRVRSLRATVDLFKQSMAGVTEREINAVRHTMVANGVISRADPSPSHVRDLEPLDGNGQRTAFEMAVRDGSERLHRATQAMFERKARAHGVSIDGARLATLYSHDELLRMSRVGLAA